MFTRSESQKNTKGFTLIEVLIVIGIIAILAGIVIVAINPARQFAQARNAQRTSNVNSILNAIGQNIADNKGLFKCDFGSIDGTLRTITNDTSVTDRTDLRECLAPTYIPEIPVDPKIGVPLTGTTYNTGYKVTKDVNGRITVSAPEADTASELNQKISVTR